MGWFDTFKLFMWDWLFKNDQTVIIGSYEDRIKTIEEDLSGVTLQFTELEAAYTSLQTKYKIELEKKNELIKVLKDPDANVEKPSFLNNEPPYTPRVHIAHKDGNKIIPLQPTEIYTKNSAVCNIVKNGNWKELYAKDKKACAQAIWEYVIKSIVYVSDNAEDWRFSPISINMAEGDCVANYEEIYTKEGIKNVGDLKVGDIVLSYDFKKKKYVYKPIIKIWEKGKLPIKRAHLRNGHHIDITENHPLWVRTNQKYSEYKKTYLGDVDLTRWWKRKMPIVKKLPYNIKDIGWLNEELCFVIGHYLAEGYNGKTCGYVCPDVIIPLLEKHNIPFTETKNNSGVPVVRFLKSEFKEYLKRLKNNSFNINIPEELFHLPKEKLIAILYGHCVGDGHLCKEFTGKKKRVSNAEYVHSTSSKQLAMDLVRIYYQIGRPIQCWKQENHQGVGNKPIWRLTLNTKSHFNKDFGYKGISEVSISYVEDLPKTEMRDFTVDETHTFVFKNGLISHQCEDGAIMFVDLARESGFRPDEVFNACGYLNKKFGHSYPILNYGEGWFIYESTLNAVPSAPKKFKGSTYEANWGLGNWRFAGKLTNGVTQI